MEALFAGLNIKEDEKDDQVVREKQSIREKVWNKLEEKQAVRPYPPSCFGKIPNFRGNNFASDKVTNLREFRRAKVIKVNPSLAQMDLRHEILKANKILVVPSPALAPYDENQQGANDTVFCYMLDGSRLTNKEKKYAMGKKGSIALGRPLLDDWSKCPKIDLVVVGSVAVTLSGRRLGKGHGFAELEWAILYELGVVSESTIVITTIHEHQIVYDEDFGEHLQEAHDLPVDIIVTPRRILNVRPKLRKPTCGIIWDKISDERLKSIAILQKLKKA